MTSETATPHVPSRSKKRLIFVRIILGSVSLALFAFSLTGFLNFDQLAPQQYWWIMIAAFAVAITSVSALGDYQKAGIVAASFVAGFGMQLALKDPLWFQHVRIPLSGFLYVALVVLGVQGAVAATVLFRNNNLRCIFHFLSGLDLWRVLVFLVLMVVASRSLMEPIARQDMGHYVKQLVAALAFLGLNVASLVALMIALPGNRLQAVAETLTNRLSFPGSTDKFRKYDTRYPYIVAGFTFILCTVLAVVSFEGVPHLDDIVYLFQARYHIDGMVSLPIPPVIEAFDHYLMNSYQDKWFATTFPGWPLVLGIGALFDMPWIVNPVLAACSILLLHSFVTSTRDRGTANLAVTLMAASPWYLSMSSTMLIHTFTYALVLAAWVLLIKTRNRPSIMMPLVAGALMGWLFLSRPLDGLLIGTLTGFWLLSFLEDRHHWKTVVFYSIGAISIGAIIFPYNIYLTGDPLTTPLNAYYDVFWGPGSNALGFGADAGAVPDWGTIDVFKGHSPVEALINAHQNLYETNLSLFGWGGASLAFVFIFVIWGKWTRLSAAMAIIVVGTVGLYSLYWFYGGFYAGPRYWFLILVPLLILTCQGIGTCVRISSRILPDAMVAQRMGAGVAFLCLCGVFVFESWLGFNRYPEVMDHHDDYQKLAGQEQFQNSLVFIHLGDDEDYGSAFWLNDFGPNSASPLFARDLGASANRKTAAAFPDRKIFFVNGRSKESPNVTLTRGPLTLDDLE
jgi:hypothetical protein